MPPVSRIKVSLSKKRGAVQFVCLGMSDAFIDAHFGEIRENACAIEARLNDAECTPDELKEDNRRYIDAFKEGGEKVTLIESDYEETIRTVLEELHPRNTSSITA